MTKIRTSIGETLSKIEQAIRPRRVGAGLVGMIMLSGCADMVSTSYSPDIDATCTIISAGALEPNYEADRWADTTAERDRLVEEINSHILNNGDDAQYAICFDDNQVPHAPGVEQLARIAQYFGEHEHGIDIPGLAVPAVISATDFEVRFETEIDPGHGF